MNPENNEIYELIARSLTDRLTEEESAVLEYWKLAAAENLQEYNDIVALWIKSGALRLPESLNFKTAQKQIYTRTGIYSGRKRVITLLIQAAAVVVLAVIFSGVYSFLNRSNTSSNSNSLIAQEVKAAYGTQTKIALSDGTIVYLNSGSKLIFPQSFADQKQRHVTLDGEGYFEVAKNKEQPFVVSARELQIKVLGTKFNVDAYGNNSSVSVALVEGSVELQNKTNNETLKLAPNQLAVLDAESKTLVSDDVTDLNKYTAWINGRIVFYGDPIQTVVKKLSNWYNIDIVISDKKLESYKFTGTFINEPVEQVLNVLSLTSKMAFEVEPAVKQADNTITKRRIILKSKI